MGPDAGRVIGGWAATSVVVGSMVGIGVFLAPPVVAAHVPSTLGFVLVWLAGGLTALAGAVAIAELGTMMPHAGGDYVFVREAFGPSVSFAAGWVLFGPVFAGSIAAIASALCHHQIPALLQAAATGLGLTVTVDLSASVPGLPFALPWARVLAAGLVLAVTAANVLGTRLSAGLQGLLTGTAIACLLVLAIAGLVTGVVGSASPAASSVEWSLSGIVQAYLPVYFAYSGWNALVYVAGEVREPGRTLPRALFGGTTLVTALYLLLVTAFVLVFGLVGLRDVGEAGSALALHLGGPSLAVVVAGVLLLALLGALNGSVLGGARVAYAMARSGAFWSGAAHLGGRGVPTRALWIQALLAVVFALTGTFEQVLALAGLAMQLTGTLGVASLFVLRWKAPARERPYRATGYPYVPALYLAVSGTVMAVVAVGSVRESGLGARLPFLGLVAFAVAWVFHRLRLVPRGQQP